MPKVSNEFQAMVKRIESAFHGTDAKVEESGLVYNGASQKHEEIDVVITFNLGGREYRTGIACRDRSRNGDPDWIRALATQRDDCKLDKMVAVHSVGFTDGAENVAKTHNIEIIAASEVSGVDWPTLLVPTIFSTNNLVRFANINLLFRDAKSHDDVHQDSVIEIPNCGRITPKQATLRIDAALRDHFTPRPKPGETHKSFDDEYICAFDAPFGEGTAILEPSGARFPLAAIVGRAAVRVIFTVLDKKKVIQYKDKRILELSGELDGRKVYVTSVGDLPEASSVHFDMDNPGQTTRRVVEKKLRVKIPEFLGNS